MVYVSRVSWRVSLAGVFHTSMAHLLVVSRMIHRFVLASFVSRCLPGLGRVMGVIYIPAVDRASHRLVLRRP
jgi:hypothetical protein